MNELVRCANELMLNECAEAVSWEDVHIANYENNNLMQEMKARAKQKEAELEAANMMMY